MSLGTGLCLPVHDLVGLPGLRGRFTSIRKRTHGELWILRVRINELAKEKAKSEPQLVSTDSAYDLELGECSSCGKTEEEDRLEVF